MQDYKNYLAYGEGPDSLAAHNIRSCLNNARMGKCELSMAHFFRNLTIVTDGAAVTARVAYASFSREIHDTGLAQVAFWVETLRISLAVPLN